MRITRGSRRIVFVFKKVVIKIPRFTSWLSFILGIMENLHERYWYCGDGLLKDPKEWYADNCSCRHLAQIYWADRFGFFVVMERVRILRDIPEEADEFEKASGVIMEKYKGLDIVSDIKPSNVGIREDGRPVLIDYGFFGGVNQMYLGRKSFTRAQLDQRLQKHWAKYGKPSKNTSESQLFGEIQDESTELAAQEDSSAVVGR